MIVKYIGGKKLDVDLLSFSNILRSNNLHAFLVLIAVALSVYGPYPRIYSLSILEQVVFWSMIVYSFSTLYVASLKIIGLCGILSIHDSAIVVSLQFPVTVASTAFAFYSFDVPFPSFHRFSFLLILNFFLISLITHFFSYFIADTLVKGVDIEGNTIVPLKSEEQLESSARHGIEHCGASGLQHYRWKSVNIPVSNIVRVEADGQYVYIITQKKNFYIRGKFSSAILQLPSILGMRVHRSHWVSFSQFKKLRRHSYRTTLELKDGTLLPVSREKIHDVSAFFSSSDII
jgi:hypothetical protein